MDPDVRSPLLSTKIGQYSSSTPNTTVLGPLNRGGYKIRKGKENREKQCSLRVFSRTIGIFTT